MKKNSRKPSFKLLFALIALLIIGLIFGAEVLRIILICIAIFAVAIFIIGIVILLTITIIEKVTRSEDENDENPSV